jgi:mannose-6-phosphate isomerase
MPVGFPPLAFSPVYKDKIWGGRTLERLGKVLPPDAAIGESWELSGYGKDSTPVADGPWAGSMVADLLAGNREAILGSRITGDLFPLLYKFIDANDNLSIQVHPTDDQAKTYGWDRAGKTECWYIVGARPKAQIIAGFRPGVTLPAIEAAVRDNTLPALLNFVPIESGDMLFIPAGTVHAILEGTLLYEVQETSDITLRLYDWGRLDAAGNPRDLHVAESMLVLDTEAHDRHKIVPVALRETGGSLHRLRVACRYFAVEEYLLQPQGRSTVPHRNSFQVLTVMAGTVELITSAGERTVKTGETVLLASSLASIEIDTVTSAHALVSWVPDIASEVIAPLRASGRSVDEIAGLGGFAKYNDILPLL